MQRERERERETERDRERQRERETSYYSLLTRYHHLFRFRKIPKGTPPRQTEWEQQQTGTSTASQPAILLTTESVNLVLHAWCLSNNGEV